MGPKMAGAFATIFMDKTKTDMSSISSLNKQINPPIIKLTTEIFVSEATFCKGERFNRESVLDMRTHFNPRDTFQYTFYTTCHPLGAKKGFVKGGTLQLPWITFSKINLKRTLNSSKYTWLRETTRKRFLTTHSQKRNLNWT